MEGKGEQEKGVSRRRGLADLHVRSVFSKLYPFPPPSFPPHSTVAPAARTASSPRPNDLCSHHRNIVSRLARDNKFKKC